MEKVHGVIFILLGTTNCYMLPPLGLFWQSLVGVKSQCNCVFTGLLSVSL